MKHGLLKTVVCAIALLFALNLSAYCEERFGGLGLTVTQQGGELVVTDVLSGTDAQAKGIRSGDVITRINGESTMNQNFETLVTTKLRGAVGSVATLEVRRAGVREPLTFEVRRSEIRYPR